MGEQLDPDRAVKLVLPAAPSSVPMLRRRASEFASEQGMGEELVADVALAVSEAATNAVKYARAVGSEDVVELCVVKKEDCLEVRVRDRGGAFGQGFPDGLGLGLTIIARLTAELKIVQEGDGTEVRMRFPLAAE